VTAFEQCGHKMTADELRSSDDQAIHARREKMESVADIAVLGCFTGSAAGLAVAPIPHYMAGPIRSGFGAD
jgi:hypothetical protein